jgi:hypothetical protein
MRPNWKGKSKELASRTDRYPQHSERRSAQDKRGKKLSKQVHIQHCPPASHARFSDRPCASTPRRGSAVPSATETGAVPCPASPSQRRIHFPSCLHIATLRIQNAREANPAIQRRRHRHPTHSRTLLPPYLHISKTGQSIAALASSIPHK